jgi:hypothetical protein
MRNWTRTMFVYGMLWLALIIVSKLSFAGLTLWFYTLAVDQVPKFSQQVQELQARHADDPEALQQGMFKLMQPTIESRDWLSIRISLCLVVFIPIGFMAGFLSGDPRWAGALPVVALLPQDDPCNPAVMPFPHVVMAGLDEQVLLFGLQIAVVYGCAWSGAVRYWRRRGPQMLLEDDEEENFR